jgi:hypothetical protein
MRSTTFGSSQISLSPRSLAALPIIQWWLAAPHYLVSEGVADEIIFETVKKHDLPCLRRQRRCA